MWLPHDGPPQNFGRKVHEYLSNGFSNRCIDAIVHSPDVIHSQFSITDYFHIKPLSKTLLLFRQTYYDIENE